eukprot:TRINITY_DN695_c0_g1_i1.p1 TRINITY_DN695_c0_g1~~TRINITY_DN695_c0_g1_i1.p1  ORF type:complete len:193 (+),score=49.19 TRINITY_DN695_c0_g1_i1:99-677(+)
MSNSKPHNPSSLQVFGEWYLGSLKKNPIRTKALTSAILSFLSNVIAQKFIEKRRGLDYARLIRFTVFALLSSPVTHKWYELCDSIFRGRKSSTQVYERLALDQLLFAPFINVYFFTVMCILGGNPSSAPAVVRSQLWPTLKASWKVWPLAQFINFNFVPPQLRVLFGNFVAFFWSMYLSSLSSKTATKKITN